MLCQQLKRWRSVVSSRVKADHLTMLGIPLEMGYTCPQFEHTIFPSSTCIWRHPNQSQTNDDEILGTYFEENMMKSPEEVVIDHIRLFQRQRSIAYLRNCTFHICSYIIAWWCTCLAASTRAAHSILGRKPRRKSGLNSASCSSIWTSLNAKGKLLEVQFFTWHARRLWVIKRTMKAETKDKSSYCVTSSFMLRCVPHHHRFRRKSFF